MDLYHLVLFIHILALVVAAGVTAVTKLAAARRARARTVGDVLDWHTVLISAARLFPMCLAVLVLTGAYMVSRTQSNVWSAGFVVAGLVGSGLLLASGVFLGIKGKALKQFLEELAKGGADRPAPRLVPPPIVAVLPTINSGIALGVVFDMVTKPTSVAIALSAIAVGIVMGGAVGMRSPAPVAERVRAAS